MLFRILCLGLTLCLPLSVFATVKMSKSGICHPVDSAFYERTKNFTAYTSLPACLAAGGRTPEGYLSTSASVPTPALSGLNADYSRAQFGSGWADVDGDCQNARHETLVAYSTAPVRFKTNSDCRVVAGRWISPFTGQVIHNPAEMDIDHVVPLKWAWEHGAKDWQLQQRIQFANDHANLLSVEASLNRQKGAQGPDTWLPPQNQCQYILRFMRVVTAYKLELSEREKTQFKTQKGARCKS